MNSSDHLSHHCQGNTLTLNTQKWKQKPFPAGPIKPDNCLVVHARETLNILAETLAFSRWESAYIGFMQTFPHLVCNHPFAAKQFSVIANSLHSSEFKILPLPKIGGISIAVLSEMKEVEASLTIQADRWDTASPAFLAPGLGRKGRDKEKEGIKEGENDPIHLI